MSETFSAQYMNHHFSDKNFRSQRLMTCDFRLAVQIQVVAVVVVLFYIHDKQLRSCWDGQLT